jgi:glycosyltransferase involved in cell wall biosynthesis
VSVVIPCYNYGSYVVEAVDSVLNQTWKDLEIFVVDGGSEQATVDILKNLDRPRTQVMLREGRHFVGDNRNFGIERARGKYICCLDADDRLHPTYLEKAVFLAETGAYDLVFPSVQCFGESDALWLVDDISFERCLTENGVSTVALFRREAWRAAGGYRDWGVRDHLVHEDWDLWVRIIGSGFRTKSLREPLMFYRVHRQGLTGTSTKSLAEHASIIREKNLSLLEPRFRHARDLAKREVEVFDPRINLNRAFDQKRPHVLFALPFTVIGGADTILVQIAFGLREAGFDVSVVTTLDPHAAMGDGSPAFESITKDVFHLPRFLSDDQSRADFLFHLLETRATSILFLVGSAFTYELLPRIRSRFPKLRVVDQLFNEFGHLERNRRFADSIDLHVVATEKVRDLLLTHHGQNPATVRLIHHGVDIAAFDPGLNPSREHTSTSRPRKRRIGFVGRFSEEKNPLGFVSIATRLEDRDDVEFLMIGDGPLFEDVRRKIRSAGIRERLALTRFVHDVRPYLHSMEALVIPSQIEGIPIVLLEAQALGIPVVASNVGGIPVVLENGQNGFLCDPANEAEFASRLEWILDHPEDRVRMGNFARRRIQESFNLNRMIEEYVSAFRSILPEHSLL